MPIPAPEKLKGDLTLAPVGPRARRPITAMEQVGAAFQLDNVIASSIGRLSEPDPEADPNFDFRDHLAPEELLIQETFAETESLTEMNQVRERIKNEQNARVFVEQGPLPGLLATSIAVLADPTTYVPIAGAVGKTAAGARIAARAGRVGVAAAGEIALSEAALQAAQETRTATESLAAVLLGAAFGTGLGAAVGATAAREGASGVDRMLKEATDDVVTTGEAMFPGGSAGAMAARAEPGDTELAAGPMLKTFARVMGQARGVAAPSLELATSKIAAARDAVLQLVDTGMVTKGQAKGLATPAALETKIKAHEAVVADTFNFVDRQYKDFRKAGGSLSRREFNEQVGRAMRRGDDSAIPFVKETARTLRDKVFEPYKRDAIAAGLLPKDVTTTTALSYFTRVYKREMLRDAGMRLEFRNRIVDWFRSVGRSDEFENVADMESAAEDIIDTILGSPAGRVPLVGDAPGARGPLRERTFNIPDEMIEDFLDSDVVNVASRYVRTMSSDIETVRALGTLNGEDLAAKINDEAKAASEKALKAGKSKQANAILEEGERQSRLVQELLNEIRGVRGGPMDPSYQMARRVLKTGRDINFLRLLGSVLISSIPDVGRVVMEEGLVKSFGPLLQDMMGGFKAIRMGVAEARAAGTALDLMNGQRSAAMFDISDRFMAQSTFERGVDTGAKLFGRVSLLDPWNTALKGWTSVVAGTRILKTSQALAGGGKISKRDIRKLAQSGISEDLAQRIAKESDKWAEMDGAILPNVLEWTDREAAHAFRNALLRDIDNTIITPGAGDAPLWTTTDFGRSVFQFKRFAMASTQRILISGMQTRDMATLNGVVVMMALGAMGTAIRDMTFESDGKPLGEVRERTAPQWVADAVDRSGVASMFFELNNMVEKFAGKSAVSALTGKEVSRFAGRDLIGQALGPSAGLAQDLGAATSNALRDDFTRPDLHRIRKLFPGQNLFYLRGLLDKAEKATGLPARQPRRRRPKNR